MKKLMLIVVVLMMAAPLYAENEIRFSFVDNWDGTCTVTYDVNDVSADPCDPPPVRPVAMGLTVDVTGGSPITSVVCADETDFMEIFMDSAYDMEDPCGDPCTSYAYGAGQPIAIVDAPGEAQLAAPWDPCDPCTVTANDGALFAISMGGLGGELAKTKDPPRHGSIIISSDGGSEFELYVNALRGGIIGEDGDPMVPLGLDVEPAKNGQGNGKISECYKDSDRKFPKPFTPFVDPETTSWYNSGKPVSWCFPRQCHGDADGRAEGNPWTGFYRVDNKDLNVVGMGWFTVGSPATPNYDPPFGTGVNNKIHPGTGRKGTAADFGHDKLGNQWTGYYRIDNGDLNEMGTYFLVNDPPFTQGGKTAPAADCWDGPTTEIHPCTGQPGTYDPVVDEASFPAGICYGL